MIQPTFDMIPRTLLVLFIIHIVVFIIDEIRISIIYKHMNKIYYWKSVSTMSTLFYIDAALCILVCAVLALKYILIGNIL